MLTNVIYRSDECCVYPGEYEPIPGQKKELYDELKKNKTVTMPAVTVIGEDDYYRIEMAAPGFNREDFFINTDGPVLSISAMTKRLAKPEKLSAAVTDHYKCIQRDIVLPPDVDTEFVTAVYANGILSVWLFRTATPVVSRPGHIVVY